MNIENNLEAIRIIKSNPSSLTTEQRQILENFNGWGAYWQIFKPSHPRHKEIRNLLSDEEFEIANSTILNAHYTNPGVVECVHRILKAIGVPNEPLIALEPSCGIGYFLKNTPYKWTCVEIDPIAAKITKLLYPEASVYNMGFEKFQADEIFDIVIGNVPFGNYSVNEIGYEGLKIHNHFIIKSIDLLKPKGLAAIITSTGTLDSKNNTGFRKRLASKATLISAFRLPSTTMANANTDVTTDLLIFKKEPDKKTNWIETTPVYVEETKVMLNDFYRGEHRRNMLGFPILDKSYARPRFALAPAKDSEPLIHSLSKLASLIGNCYESTEQKNTNLLNEYEQKLTPYRYHAIGGFTDGFIYYKTNKTLRKIGAISENLKLFEIIKLAEQTEKLLKTQSPSDRELLNKLYDKFLKSYRSIKNIAEFKDDARYELLLSLEVNGKKAPIFNTNTCRTYEPPAKCANAKDALLHCLKMKGRLDLQWIAAHC